MIGQFDDNISSERLLLKPYILANADNFYRLISNNRSRLVTSFPVTVAACETLEQTKQYMVRLEEERRKKIMLTYGIYLKDTGEHIGYISAKSIEWKIPKCELGYFIDSWHEGKGYITEAVNTIVEYCFSTLKMKKILIRIVPGNIASRRVAERAGFTLEGTLRNEHKTYDGELMDVEYFGKIPEY